VGTSVDFAPEEASVDLAERSSSRVSQPFAADDGAVREYPGGL
jgi:hypothetical protein